MNYQFEVYQDMLHDPQQRFHTFELGYSRATDKTVHGEFNCWRARCSRVSLFISDKDYYAGSSHGRA